MHKFVGQKLKIPTVLSDLGLDVREAGNLSNLSFPKGHKIKGCRMQGFHKKMTQAGFSLVELMIVVGIIGILATLAVPRFQQFQAKARMGEAKNMLNHVYTLEESYFLDRDIYLNMVAYGSANAGGNCNAANQRCCPRLHD